MSNFSENLKYLREKNKMEQNELATLLNRKSASSISEWESGKYMPRSGTLSDISKIFNVSLSDLMNSQLNADNIVHVPFRAENNYLYYDTVVSAGVLTATEAFNNTNADIISLPNIVMGKYAGRIDLFVTKINGDSMNNVFSDGSLIVVKRVLSPFELDNGEIVVFRSGDGLSVKRLYNDMKNERLIFRPDSVDDVFTEIVINYEDAHDLQIYGKVVLYIVEL